MAVNKLGMSMVGRKAAGAVKKPARVPSQMKGKKTSAKGIQASGKNLTMADGVKSGVIKTAF